MAISSEELAQSIRLASATSRTRVDIQALRGWAVLTVVLYHLGLGKWIPAGYLGVDIFFVISGYLITAVVRRGLESGTFSIAGFYARRAKRLLPAAYVVFVGTAAAAAFVLPPRELRDFMAQLLGATTFTANMVLWGQTGYFAEPASTKLLLHTWSLSIEEQYYLVLPAALVFTPSRWWRPAAAVAGLASLALCFAAVGSMPGATFYLLPTRAWELALGSVGALAGRGWQSDKWVRIASWPASIAILAIPFLELPFPHPGVAALAVCACTLVVLVRGESKSALAAPILWLPSRLGDISYSLYLIHWPLLALAANAWLTQVPVQARVSVLLASLVLATLLHVAIERPLRELPVSRMTNAGLLAATVFLLALASCGLAGYAPEASAANPRAANWGLGAECEYGNLFDARPTCQTGAAPRVMIWGDSQAMHLVDAVRASTDASFIQATKTRCGPLLAVSTFDDSGVYNRTWAKQCLAFNRSVMEYLANSPGIEVVVIASWLTQYTEHNRLLREGADPGDQTQEIEGSQAMAFEALRITIQRIRSLGKKVVLVSPAPASDFDVARCIDQHALGKLSFGADTVSCEIDAGKYRAGRAPAIALMDAVERERIAPVIRLDRELCGPRTCVVTLGGIPLYRDAGHFSRAGSRELGRRLRLGVSALAAAT